MIKPIRTDEEYEFALTKLHRFIRQGYVEGTAEADEADVLSILIHSYEEEHYPIPPPHPVEAIKFRLEQMGKNEEELSKILGHQNNILDILSGKKKLSLAMIRKLHNVLKIPAETLIATY
jgi:HTH-type transcriptional regulator / antitoxin HigA